MSKPFETLKNNVLFFIQKNNLSKGEFATLMGVSQQRLSNILNSDSEPSIEVLESIAKAMKCDFYELLMSPESNKDVTIDKLRDDLAKVRGLFKAQAEISASLVSETQDPLLTEACDILGRLSESSRVGALEFLRQLIIDQAHSEKARKPRAKA